MPSHLWMMLAASMLAVTVAYAGTATGASFLPARIPALPDLILPLALVLFGVLAHQVNTPQATVAAWYLTSTGYGTFAAISVARARAIVKKGRYPNDLRDAIHAYTRRLFADAIAAAMTAVVGCCPSFFCRSTAIGQQCSTMSWCLS
jgi:hypothetical protein